MNPLMKPLNLNQSKPNLEWTAASFWAELSGGGAILGER